MQTTNRRSRGRAEGRGRLRKTILLFAAVWMTLFPATVSFAENALAQQEIPEGWELFEQPWGKKKDSPYMWYWVRKPKDMKPGLPLLVYLHSSGGCCNHVMTSEALTGMLNDGTIADPQAVILVPQHPGDYDSDWLSAMGSVNSIIENVIEKYQIDTDRIALAGFSLGGVYVWEYAVSAPGRYSRVMSICGKVHYLRIPVEAFEGCEVRAYTARRDETVNPATVNNFVDRLQEAGIKATRQEFELKHIEVPSVVFADEEVQEWLWLRPEK